MAIQILLVREAFGAHSALVRFLAEMEFHVGCEEVVVREEFVADFAFELAFGVVGQFVGFQLVGCCESSGTNYCM